MSIDSDVSYSSTLRKYRKFVFRSDIAIIFAATLTAYSLRYQGLGVLAHESFYNFILVCALPIFWLFSLHVSKAWNFTRVENLSTSLRSVAQSGWRATVLLGFTSYIVHHAISRLWVFFSSGAIFICLTFTRLLIESLLNKNLAVVQETHLYIASNQDVFDPKMIFVERGNSGVSANYLRVDPPNSSDDEVWLNSLERRILEESIDGIIVTESANVDADLLVRISKFYYLGIIGIRLYTPLAPELSQFTTIEHDNWVRIEEPQIVNSGYAIKRLFDLIFSLLMLILLSPLLLAIAIGVKVTSKGPILYNAKRMGAGRTYFTFPKFRTMVKDAHAMRDSVIGEPDAEIAERYRNDPRITSFGRFLRRWSLDELPQLWCVLIGTMSVVGPRPILEDEYHLVSSQSRFRSIVTPGLTGLWQINGRKEVGWQERMDMDTYYIQSWSFWHDMVLIIRTFAAIISGRGSY